MYVIIIDVYHKLEYVFITFKLLIENNMIIKINSTKNDKIRRLSDFTPASLARSTLYLLDDYIVIRRRGYHTPPGGETISRVIELFLV